MAAFEAFSRWADRAGGRGLWAADFGDEAEDGVGANVAGLARLADAAAAAQGATTPTSRRLAGAPAPVVTAARSSGATAACDLAFAAENKASLDHAVRSSAQGQASLRLFCAYFGIW